MTMRSYLSDLSIRSVSLVAAVGVALSPLATPGAVSAEQGEPKLGSRPELGRPGQPPASFEPGEILVGFGKDAQEADKAALHRKLGGRAKEKLAELDVEVIEVEPGKEKERVEGYKKEKKVAFAELNVRYYALGVPSDARAGEQWGLNNTGLIGTDDADIDAYQAWDAPLKTSSTTAIAILDTGIRANHEDLAGRVAKSRNFTTSPTADDRHGHGTHVAGIAAATTNNGKGVAGTCPNCVLHNVKVLGDDGYGSTSAIANGITWAANNGARVINMSFGSYSPTATMETAINSAWKKGVVLTAAAGNDGQNWGSYPAVYTKVIAVAATDTNDQRAWFSNWGGNWVDVAAPGAWILSTVRDGGYAEWDGTSMATPFVSGSAGLVWSRGGCTTNVCVRDRVQGRADAIGNVGTAWENHWARGRINACRAAKNTASC